MLCNQTDGLIALVMSVGVVDAFEVVQINEQQRKAFAIDARSGVTALPSRWM